MRNVSFWACLVILLGVAVFIQLKYLSVDDGCLFTSDTELTFKIYSRIVEDGSFHFTRDSIISTSLMTTLFPALITRWTGADPAFVFLLWNVGFIILLPASLFLLLTGYFGNFESLVGALLVMSQFYYKNALALARINIAILSFIIGLLILLRMKGQWKNEVLLLVSFLIVVSHYGTAFITTGVLLLSWMLGQLAERENGWYMPPLLFWGISLLALSVFYYGMFELGPLFYARNVILNSVSAGSGWDPTMEWLTGGLYYNFPAHDRVVKIILHYGFSVFWATLIIWLFGLFRSRHEQAVMVYLGISCTLLFVVSMLVPYLNYCYGIIRIYFTALIVLSYFYVRGGNEILKPLNISGSFLTLPLAIASYFVVIST